MNDKTLATPGVALPRPDPVAAPSRRVVDAPMRMFHWLFALSFVGAYLTADSESWRLVHISLGYTLLGLLGFRLVYGLLGPRPVRLVQLWRRASGWAALRKPVQQALAGQAGPLPWQQLLNLLMAGALLGLLGLSLPLVLSGYGLEQEWLGGSELLEELHELLGNSLLLLALLHIALLALLSVLRGKNQAAPMLSGRIPGKGPDLLPHNRGWLAALLLLAVLAFGAWQWREAPPPADLQRQTVEKDDD